MQAAFQRRWHANNGLCTWESPPERPARWWETSTPGAATAGSVIPGVMLLPQVQLMYVKSKTSERGVLVCAMLWVCSPWCFCNCRAVPVLSCSDGAGSSVPTAS